MPLCEHTRLLVACTYHAHPAALQQRAVCAPAKLHSSPSRPPVCMTKHVLFIADMHQGTLHRALQREEPTPKGHSRAALPCRMWHTLGPRISAQLTEITLPSCPLPRLSAAAPHTPTSQSPAALSCTRLSSAPSSTHSANTWNAGSRSIARSSSVT